jgi:hypothetical protein
MWPHTVLANWVEELSLDDERQIGQLISSSVMMRRGKRGEEERGRGPPRIAMKRTGISEKSS